jgi:hypothetical protein
MILVLSNWIYTRWFFEADLQEHAEIINLVLAIPADSDILYLGESSNNTFRGDDMDKRPISAFLGDFYPDLKINDITQHAAHAGIYKVLLNHIPTTNKARTIVVTLNLRSFNAQWIYSDLETALQKSLVLLKPYPPLFNRFLLSFKAYDIKTEKERQEQYRRKWRQDIFRLPFDFPFKNVSEWDAYIWKNGFTNPDGTPNDELKELVCHYIKAYAFQIDTLTNPRIKDFDEIVALAQDRNWNIVFNLLAENTEKAQEIVGDELIFMMNENAKLLEEYYSKKGVVVVNNLNAVGDDEFIDQHWTTEHYAENGRKTIARELAESLKIWHGNLYHEVALETKFKTSFFNDCDNNIPWGQTHTISTEKAFSGSKSSRIGAGEAYSITMEYPLKKIPDSLKHSLHVELLFYQKATVSEALLVVEALGDDFENYWVGFPLNDSVSEVNNWAKFEKSLVIPEHIKSANVIKVYVYNPSKHILYVDDFRITLNPF